MVIRVLEIDISRNYDEQVIEEAKCFLYDNEDMIRDAIKNGSDFDRNDIDELDEVFHYSIVDRAYSLMEAAFIVENCHEEEHDSGLWDGQSPRDAINTMAAFSFANDVWDELTALYEQIRSEYDEVMEAMEMLLDMEHEDAEPFSDDEIVNYVRNLHDIRTHMHSATPTVETTVLEKELYDKFGGCITLDMFSDVSAFMASIHRGDEPREAFESMAWEVAKEAI